MSVRLRRPLLAAGLGGMLAVVALLVECTAASGLPNGCYYADDGTAVLRVNGTDGEILTPSPVSNSGYTYTSVHHAHFAALFHDPAHILVSPGFYLTDNHSAAANGWWVSGFAISTQGVPTITVPVEGYGDIVLQRGNPCPMGPLP